MDNDTTKDTTILEWISVIKLNKLKNDFKFHRLQAENLSINKHEARNARSLNSIQVASRYQAEKLSKKEAL